VPKFINMNTRRSFLSKALMATSVGGLNWSSLLAHIQPKPDPKSVPMVIATWNNQKATAAAWEVLAKGGRALDAVEAGARIPEADPNDTSVGYGGFPDRDGKVTLDACIMDEFGNAGSVSFLQHIMHPISVARMVMEKTPHVMLCGEGALDFALKNGFVKENLLTPVAEKAWKDWLIKSEYKPKVNWERHDTIGIVSIDSKQQIAGACTTSGMAFKLHGRVGDSPVIGAGMFSDNEVGAAAATGLGEMVLRTLGSFLVVEEMRRGKSPQKAVETVIKRIAAKYPQQAKENQIGFIALDKRGRFGGYALQAGFNYAVFQNGVNKVFEAGHLYK
jgi:N4-(beta-N-acetylglucosaminyl)-L-asparaginase